MFYFWSKIFFVLKGGKTDLFLITFFSCFLSLIREHLLRVQGNKLGKDDTCRLLTGTNEEEISTRCHWWQPVSKLVNMICYREVFLLLLCLLSSVIVVRVHQLSRNDAIATDQKSVVVIGAGISGLAAARTLTNSGQWDVTLLEARKSRYGGRVWTDRVSFDRIKGD